MSGRANWSEATSWDTVCRRAAGRNGYNRRRQFQAMHRRSKVTLLLDQYGWFEHGVCARIARELGTSRATVCRDRASMRSAWRSAQQSSGEDYITLHAREELKAQNLL